MGFRVHSGSFQRAQEVKRISGGFHMHFVGSHGGFSDGFHGIFSRGLRDILSAFPRASEDFKRSLGYKGGFRGISWTFKGVTEMFGGVSGGFRVFQRFSGVLCRKIMPHSVLFTSSVTHILNIS